MPDNNEKEPVRCSFCGKPEQAVERMLHSSRANICDSCVALCYEMLVEEFGKPQEVILNYQKEIEISDIRNVRKLAAKYVIATACSCFLLFGVYAFAGLGAKSKNAEVTTEDVASQSVEIYDPIRAYLDRYGGSLYNEYGDAVITAIRPTGGNTDGFKSYVIKEVPPSGETE